MPIRLLQDMECSGKTVVIRQDLNVPMKDGRITNDKRIRAALPGIRMALDKGAGVVLLSHLGRPTEGVVEEKFSLAPVAAHLSGLLGRPVKLAADFDAAKAAPGEVVLLENIRFFKGEKKNDPELAAKLAALGDIYVMDAFGAAHRAHSSTEGAVRAAKVACAGPLMAAELDAFAKVLDAPARPLMAIIGGSKVSTKLGLLDNLLGKVDTLIVGGGIANTFLAAAGYSVGTSLLDNEKIDYCKEMMAKAEAKGVKLLLPVDAVVADSFPNPIDGEIAVETVAADAIPADKMGLDTLSATAKDLAARAKENKLTADEYKGSTITVSNLGMFGIETFTPIINQPDSVIVGVCAIEDELQMDDEGKLSKHQVMRLSVTLDHRTLDGAVVAKFEMDLRDILQNPMSIVL